MQEVEQPMAQLSRNGAGFPVSMEKFSGLAALDFDLQSIASRCKFPDR